MEAKMMGSNELNEDMMHNFYKENGYLEEEEFDEEDDCFEELKPSQYDGMEWFSDGHPRRIYRPRTVASRASVWGKVSF